MAKQYKLSYLLLGFMALVVSGLVTACKQPTVPSDPDMIKTYMDNRNEYDNTVKLIMKEGNQKFSLLRGQSITYQAGDKPPVSEPTITACQQVMTRTFCLGTRRNGGNAYFIYFEDNAPDSFRSKSIVYDRDNFKDPIWTSKTTETSNLRYVTIEPNWKLEYKYDKRKH